MSPQTTVRSFQQARRNTKHRTRNTLPFVFLNFAMTADGKTAFADHHFIPFASKRDQEHMMELRATADAVMSGARTVDLTEATLGTGGEKFRRERIRRGLREHNLRIIVSGSGSVDISAEIFKHRFSPILILTTERAGKRRLKKLREVAEIKTCGEKEINWPTTLRWLRAEWDVNRLLCEGGGELSGTLIHAGLVNELHLTVSPQIFGGRTSPTIADGMGFQKLTDAAQLKFKSAKRIGDEMFFIYTIATPGSAGILPARST